MRQLDFLVKYDPDKDTQEDLVKRILYAVIIRRLRANKPAVCFISGDSGEGKSYATIKLMEVLLEIAGINLINEAGELDKEAFNVMQVYTPLEYSKKLDKLLHDKKYKKLFMFCLHEAREVIKAKRWQSFINTAVADVNALSRRVKRICFFIVSQFIRDIDTSIRYTLNFYIKVNRPIGKASRIEIWVLWKDDNDLEKPKLRKRRLVGYLRLPNGRLKRFSPRYIQLTKPRKEFREEFDYQDFTTKSAIIKQKLEKMIAQLQLDLSDTNTKLNTMAEWYIKNIDNLQLIGRMGKKGFKLKPEFKVMHGLTDQESKSFKDILEKRLKDVGYIQEGEDDLVFPEEYEGA
jgi:hypothetical protein